MKRLILLLFAFAFMQHTEAQNVDTTHIELTQQIEDIRIEMFEIKKNYGQRINNMQIDMINFNNQHRRGVNILFLGVATSLAGVLMSIYNPESEQLIMGLGIGGAALTLGGTFVILDSFKFLGGTKSLTIRMDLIY